MTTCGNLGLALHSGRPRLPKRGESEPNMVFNWNTPKAEARKKPTGTTWNCGVHQLFPYWSTLLTVFGVDQQISITTSTQGGLMAIHLKARHPHLSMVSSPVASAHAKHGDPFQVPKLQESGGAIRNLWP